MNFKVGACALLVCLAGCSAEAPDTKIGADVGKSGLQRHGQKLPTVQLDRSPTQSIANAPDRGELIEYKNKGAATSIFDKIRGLFKKAGESSQPPQKK